MSEIIIIGVGETADIAFEYFSHDSDYSIKAFSINKQFKNSNSHLGKPLVALEKLITLYPPDKYKAFVAMGSGHLNRDRQKVYEHVKMLGYELVSYISSRAFVCRTAKIGENCFIFENNVIQHKVEIGDNVVIWSGNHIGHQTKIKNNVFLSSHCVVSGYCDIGENSFLGVNCTFADHISIGRDCFIGMGVIVGKSLPENSLVVEGSTKVSNVGSRKLCKVRDNEI